MNAPGSDIRHSQLLLLCRSRIEDNEKMDTTPLLQSSSPVQSMSSASRPALQDYPAGRTIFTTSFESGVSSACPSSSPYATNRPQECQIASRGDGRLLKQDFAPELLSQVATSASIYLRCHETAAPPSWWMKHIQARSLEGAMGNDRLLGSYTKISPSQPTNPSHENRLPDTLHVHHMLHREFSADY